MLINPRQINQNTLILKSRQKQNMSTINNTFAERVSWVVQTRDYTNVPQKQIEEEYSKLRKELQNINLQVEKALEKLDMRMVKKPKMSEHDPAHTLQITDKQYQNNNAIIDRLRKEYWQLQKRASTVTVSSKDQIDQQIQKTKLQIEKLKNKIRELKMKNKSIGDSIMSSDDLYEEIKRLQNQKEVNQRKKSKLQAKTDKVYQQISTSQLRLEQISDNFTIAQNFFSQYYGKTQQNEQQKELQQKYNHAKHCLQVVNKKNESQNNVKQQKYHILLKSLQAQMSKLNLSEQKTASIQLQNIHCKKLIIQLEQIYKLNQTKSKEILSQDPIFFTQFQMETTQKNQKNQKKTVSNINKSINDITVDKQFVNDRNKTQNKQNITQVQNDSDTKNRRIENKRQLESHQREKPTKNHSINDNKIAKVPKRQQQGYVSKQVDPQQQEDIILELDQKFKYKTKSKFGMRSSRYQKETQIGQDLPEDIMDEDEQMQEFKSRITQQKKQRKSKQNVDIIKDISRLQEKIEKIQISNTGKTNFQQQQIE